MTGLLVSVRDATEARAALEGDADLIDIKEPTAGSLGAASVDTWREIVNVVGRSKPVSVALGELLDDSVCDLARQATAMSFAKIGLSGCGCRHGWEERWREAIGRLPSGVASVAVAYADYTAANAPHPVEILDCAHRFGCSAMLFDTYSKTEGHLFDHLQQESLRELLREARQRGLKVVLAGSLRGGLIQLALNHEPDFIAVRGAVCRGDRREALDGALVAALADIVHSRTTTAC